MTTVTNSTFRIFQFDDLDRTSTMSSNNTNSRIQNIRNQRFSSPQATPRAFYTPPKVQTIHNTRIGDKTYLEHADTITQLGVIGTPKWNNALEKLDDKLLGTLLFSSIVTNNKQIASALIKLKSVGSMSPESLSNLCSSIINYYTDCSNANRCLLDFVEKNTIFLPDDSKTQLKNTAVAKSDRDLSSLLPSIR